MCCYFKYFINLIINLLMIIFIHIPILLITTLTLYHFYLAFNFYFIAFFNAITNDHFQVSIIYIHSIFVIEFKDSLKNYLTANFKGYSCSQHFINCCSVLNFRFKILKEVTVW